MTTRPRLLDLFCGGGGCSVGYDRAGFDVTGVDIAVMPAYPFFDVHQGDALAVLADRDYCRTFDAVHASPPCQAYSALAKRWPGRGHPELIDVVRDRLDMVGRPYVIENVIGSPVDGVTLCGSMFGLTDVLGRSLKRHRLFEADRRLPDPPKDACKGKAIVGVYGHGGGTEAGRGIKLAGAAAAVALGIDWTTNQAVLSQAIPPAYTEWVGRHLITRI
jgi:DNA (cytosine-5)-methyltransferase 1